jgi:plasmid stabilization system protein ParE
MASSYKINIQPRALRDALRIHDWIAQDSPRNAAKWYAGLIDAIDSLAQFPERCKRAPENESFSEDIRQLLYGKRRGVYRILFTIHEDIVRVLHVRHGAREPMEREAEEL